MISKKFLISSISGSLLFVVSGITSISLAGTESATPLSEHRSFMLAEAHQHGQEKGNRQSGMRDGESRGEGGKHRHGKDSEQGEHGRGGHNGDGHGGGGHGGQGDGGHGGGGHGGHGGGGHGGQGDGEHGDKKGGKHGDKKSDGKKKGKHDYAHMIISHADELKLTDEQLGKIVRLHLEQEKTHEAIKQELQKSMKAFKKESLKPGASDARLRDLGKTVTTAFNKMVEHHIKERNAVHAVLTGDQKNQLETLKMDHDHDSHGDENGGHGGH